MTPFEERAVRLLSEVLGAELMPDHTPERARVAAIVAGNKPRAKAQPKRHWARGLKDNANARTVRSRREI